MAGVQKGIQTVFAVIVRPFRYICACCQLRDNIQPAGRGGVEKIFTEVYQASPFMQMVASHIPNVMGLN